MNRYDAGHLPSWLGYRVQFYDFVYEQISPLKQLKRKVAILKSDTSDARGVIRFRNFVDALSEGEQPVAFPAATEIALYVDSAKRSAYIRRHVSVL